MIMTRRYCCVEEERMLLQYEGEDFYVMRR